ncbi:hypothetical protein AMECASPLE_010979 [Ameca splendens]|uniref:C-type lectin domain-containing protein n=1 Tax=Ameca splendens TaxID=208324 RepID=A0ABV0ZXR6_9TELE
MDEDLDFTTATRNRDVSPDSGGERVETADTFSHPNVGLLLQNEGAVQRKPYTTIIILLGLLSFLVLVDIGVQLKICIEKPNKIQCENHTQAQTEWQEFRLSHFYYMSAEKKNWTESRKECQRRGGDLVIINSFEKQKFIERMKIHGDSWIGLQTSDEWNVKWKWVDGSELRYSAWKQGVNIIPEAESRGYTDQQGLWMHSKTGLKHWICEKKNY